eukprot:652417-Hanusia_phi.AAC.1
MKHEKGFEWTSALSEMFYCVDGRMIDLPCPGSKDGSLHSVGQGLGKEVCICEGARRESAYRGQRMPAPTYGSIRGHFFHLQVPTHMLMVETDIVKQRIIAVVREVKAADSMKVRTRMSVVRHSRCTSGVDSGHADTENNKCRLPHHGDRRRRRLLVGKLGEEKATDADYAGLLGFDGSHATRAEFSHQAIYIIHPNEDSIEKLDAWHCMTLRVYRSQCNELVQRTKSLKELNFEFVALESQCYSLGLHDAFRTLYSPVTVAKNAMIHTIADRMLTVCVTLGEFPNITYKVQNPRQRGKDNEQETSQKPARAEFDVVEKIAKALQVGLVSSSVFFLLCFERSLYSQSNFDKQIVDGNSWWQVRFVSSECDVALLICLHSRRDPTRQPSSSSTEGEVTERSRSFDSLTSFDALTPLIHEYTYQAFDAACQDYRDDKEAGDGV